MSGRGSERSSSPPLCQNTPISLRFISLGCIQRMRTLFAKWFRDRPANGALIPQPAGPLSAPHSENGLTYVRGPIRSRLHRTEREDKPSADGRSDAHGSCSINENMTLRLLYIASLIHTCMFVYYGSHIHGIRTQLPIKVLVVSLNEVDQSRLMFMELPLTCRSHLVSKETCVVPSAPRDS